MTVTPKGKDFNKTSIGNQLVGLYYYVLDKTRMQQNDGEHTSIFGYVPTIQSINFNPFVDVSDPNIIIVPSDFDDKHFGKPNSGKNPFVYRVKDFSPLTKDLGTYTMKMNRSQLGNDYETRLLFYPFKYYMVSDGLNPPLILKPELLMQSKTEFKVRVKVGLSQASKYNLFVDGYKGDYVGNIEGIVNNNPLLYPVCSSAYASFLATQGNSFNQSNANAIAENDISFRQNVDSLDLNRTKNMVGGAMGIGGSIVSGNIGGAMTSGSNVLFDSLGNKLQREFNEENYNQKEYVIESMALARKQDYLNTPRSMKTTGNDATYNLAMAQNKVVVYEYGLQTQYEIRLSNYFKRYGYRTNAYGIPLIRSRKYWNFIKTGKSELTGKEIPMRHILELRKIFDSGITFWHVTNGAEIKNYSMQNTERS